MVGDACLPIKPSIELNPPDGMTKYYFDMGLLQDMGVHLQLSTPASNQSAPGPSTPALKKRCLQCGKSILLSEMRCHVAKHILKGDLADVNTCGFCGNDTCSVTLKKTWKKGNQQFFGIDQCDCRYFYKYGKAKKFNKKNQQN